MIKPNADILFEASWEVCNKVGGIYTVVKSKASLTKDAYKDYFLIGPYFKDKADVDLEKKSPPNELKPVFNKLKEEGIVCYFGEWQIKGEPNTILIDSKKFMDKKNDIKKALWDNFKIDSLNANGEFDEAVVWATAVGRLLEEISKVYKKKKMVAQFHEWLAGAGLLYLKKQNSKIGTIFTTHATMLGRTISSSGRDLYGILDKINPEEEAYKSGVQDKFLVERACAQNTDVFTTVSEITGIEAEKILGRKPEVLVLNGLDIGKFPTLEEVSIKHVTSREKIREFLTFHFFPHYTFDLSHTMIMFIVGRYEFKNKGIDVFIRALGNLNEKLKQEKSERTVAVFFWIPQGTNGMKVELLENKNFYRHIKNHVTFHSSKILSNIVYDFVSQKDISKSQLFTKDFLLSIKKDILHFKREGNPLIATNNINDEGDNTMLKSFMENGLSNKEEDKVKVLLYPVYLDGDDGLIDLPYYDAMAGCHLGVFPSYYEPWGYTPLEAAALGVPSITSDLAGFGRFIKPKLKGDMDDGIFVLDRFGKNENETVDQFSDLLYKFSQRDNRARAKNKLRAKELARSADWGILIENYIKAHNLALKNRSG
ncbi:glycosyltransferase [Nanoarchaeota archaeon]